MVLRAVTFGVFKLISSVEHSQDALRASVGTPSKNSRVPSRVDTWSAVMIFSGIAVLNFGLPVSEWDIAPTRSWTRALAQSRPDGGVFDALNLVAMTRGIFRARYPV